VIGFLLLLLSAGLWRRRRGAFWTALAALAAGAVFSLLKGLDWEEASGPGRDRRPADPLPDGLSTGGRGWSNRCGPAG
jgi:hypothetical protein